MALTSPCAQTCCAGGRSGSADPGPDRSAWTASSFPSPGRVGEPPQSPGTLGPEPRGLQRPLAALREGRRLLTGESRGGGQGQRTMGSSPRPPAERELLVTRSWTGRWPLTTGQVSVLISPGQASGVGHGPSPMPG